MLVAVVVVVVVVVLYCWCWGRKFVSNRNILNFSLKQNLFYLAFNVIHQQKLTYNYVVTVNYTLNSLTVYSNF